MTETLEIKVKLNQKETVLLNVFRALDTVENSGLLQDIIYLSQRVGAIEKGTFEYDLPHPDVVQKLSSDIYDGLKKLVRWGVVFEFSDGLKLNARQRAEGPTGIHARLIKELGSLDYCVIQDLSRTVQVADALKIDFDAKLSKEDSQKLSEQLIIPKSQVRSAHQVYRTIKRVHDANYT